MSLKKKQSKLSLLAILASFLIAGVSAKATFAEEADAPETTGGDDGQSQTEDAEATETVYELNDEKEVTKRRTYRFVVTDGEDFDIWDEQVLKNGDTLLNPATPVKEGYRFAGWVDESDNMIDFATAVSDIETDNEVRMVYAKFDRIFVVTFLRELMNEWVVYRQESGVDAGAVATDTTFTVEDDEVLLGWAESQDATEPEFELDDEIVFGEDTEQWVYTLYPVIAKTKWITFETNGGQPLDPMAVKPGTRVRSGELPEPVRTGYRFDGWYRDADFRQEYHSSVINSDLTLYARWTPTQQTRAIVNIDIYLEDENGEFVKSDQLSQTRVSAIVGTYYAPTVEGYEVDTENGHQDSLEVMRPQMMRIQTLAFYYKKVAESAEVDVNTGYKLVYLDEDGETVLVEDENIYIEGVNAVVAEYADPARVFIGWIDKNGNFYLPNETLAIAKAIADAKDPEAMRGLLRATANEPTMLDIRLTAQYGEQKAAASIVYYRNDGGTTAYNDLGIVLNNHDYTILDLPDGFARGGYEFVGWNTKADGSGAYFMPGEIVALTGEANELFAIWKKIPETSVTPNTGHVTRGSDGAEAQVLSGAVIMTLLAMACGIIYTREQKVRRQ